MRILAYAEIALSVPFVHLYKVKRFRFTTGLNFGPILAVAAHVVWVLLYFLRDGLSPFPLILNLFLFWVSQSLPSISATCEVGNRLWGTPKTKSCTGPHLVPCGGEHESWCGVRVLLYLLFSLQ